MENFGEQFLHQKDTKLHTSEPVEHEVERRKRVEEKVSQKPADKIADWLKIIERTHMGHRDDPEVAERIKEHYHGEHVIKPEDIPESAYALEQRIAREMGYGDVEITEEFKKRKQEQIISDQTNSLDKWIDYLTSTDANYPTWAKYWVFKSVVAMGKLEKGIDQDQKETARFATRKPDTTAPFPLLNPAALAMTIDVLRSRLEEKQKSKDERQPVANISKKLSNEEFQELLTTENFSKLYKQFLLEQPMYSSEGLQEIRGKWVTYPRGSDPELLTQSLEGYPLEWCIRAIGTARDYLDGGDMHIYYSIDESGEAVIPRLAIRMQEDSIAEVRGIAGDQNLDPYIAPVVEAKMKEFPDGVQYDKKSKDMKRLTELENKTRKGEVLNKEDLRFLYEMDSKIEGFGYHRDPRIEEIQKRRNSKEDIQTIFDFTEQEVATTPEEVTEQTKAYLGPWNVTVYNKLQNFPKLQHLYESFPDKPIFRYELHTNPNIDSPQKAEEALKVKGIYVSDWEHDILQKTEFSHEGKIYNLVQFTVAQLGFPQGATTSEIYAKAKELGLDLCPAEVGPHLRLSYEGSDWKMIAMEKITDRRDSPGVFYLRRDGGALILGSHTARSGSGWNDDDQFVFCSSKNP